MNGQVWYQLYDENTEIKRSIVEAKLSRDYISYLHDDVRDNDSCTIS